MNGSRRPSSTQSASTRKTSSKIKSATDAYNDPMQKSRYKSFLFSPGVREKLIRLGFINRAGKVLTSLQEFNNYRMHLRKINDLFAKRHKVSESCALFCGSDYFCLDLHVIFIDLQQLTQNPRGEKVSNREIQILNHFLAQRELAVRERKLLEHFLVCVKINDDYNLTGRTCRRR